MNPKRDQGGRSSDLADVPSLARARYVLANTLNEHLVRSSRSLSLEEGGSSLTDGLSYASAIRVLDDGDRETNTQQESDSANSESFTRAASLKSPPGGLSEADLNRFGGSSLRVSSISLYHTLKRYRVWLIDTLAHKRTPRTAVTRTTQHAIFHRRSLF